MRTAAGPVWALGRRAPMLTILLALAACTVGGWDPDQLQSGRGARVELTTVYDQEVEAELLLVDEEGMFLLVEDRLRRAPWPAVDALVFDRHWPIEDVVDGQVPQAEHFDQIRLASRYPFGLTDEQMGALLAYLGQDAPETLR